MKAEIYYQTGGEKAIEVSLLARAELAVFLESAPTATKNAISAQKFKGSYGEIAMINHPDGSIEKIILGLGEGDEVLAVTYALNRLPAGVFNFNPPLQHNTAVSWALEQYRFDQFKKIDLPLRVLTLSTKEQEAVLREVNPIFLVRDLINTPANYLTPQTLAAAAQNLAHRFNAKYEQWVGQELLDHNFPAIYAVGQASAIEPRLISITWGDPTHPKVTLVGKGVCFDSGGLDIKPASNMRLMKKDMGGAAQVLGLGLRIMSEALPIRLQILIPAVENVIGSNAYRPGDILTMRNGLTVEIDNTDAEGRLILADALVKACEEEPELIIDFATLTGAARTAVGTDIAAMFSNHDVVAQEVLSASHEVQDPVWRMPLFMGYQAMLESSVADMVNSASSPYAGAITAALFLQKFIKPTIPWLHFDIMAWNLSSRPGKPEGGEAMAIRAIGQYLLKCYRNK